jgi:hypothetical protein
LVVKHGIGNLRSHIPETAGHSGELKYFRSGWNLTSQAKVENLNVTTLPFSST